MLKEYRGKIDLIYIDPPFDSKADYKKKIEVKGIGKAETDSTSFEEKQYGDIWSNDEYLQFMYERLIILRELLSDHGCIYLHCDWHKSHHLRMIMDEVFGNNKFVNEVIWHYSGAGTPKGCWAKRHDNIYVYSKTTEYTFNADAVRTEYAETTKERFSHAINNVRNGINFGTQSLNPLGKYPEDVLDVSIEAPSANVRTGYPTQKPEALLEKIIEASSNPGDIVFDCFMGSGTKVRVLPPPRTITMKKIWHEYKLEEKEYSAPIDFKLRDIDYSKYASVMYEKDTIARDSSLKEKNIDCIRDQMKFSAFSLAGELARYLNISCILASRILRESVDGIDAILEAVNKYNEILNDVIVPGVFHALYEVKSELHTEDKELVLLKEPKDAGYYEFSAKDELVITNQYKALTQEQIAKSFHADTYCFDSKPEKECFLQYITNSKIKEVYFTGMFTANQGDLSVQYYDPESGRIRHYYPDFLAKLEDGSYQLIEVKGDNKIDDTVVKAKAAAAQEMAVASGIEYKMYAGSEIMTTHILAYLDGMSSTINYADYMQQSTLSMVAETPAPYGSDK